MVVFGGIRRSTTMAMVFTLGFEIFTTVSFMPQRFNLFIMISCCIHHNPRTETMVRRGGRPLCRVGARRCSMSWRPSPATSRCCHRWSKSTKQGWDEHPKAARLATNTRDRPGKAAKSCADRMQSQPTPPSNTDQTSLTRHTSDPETKGRSAVGDCNRRNPIDKYLFFGRSRYAKKKLALVIQKQLKAHQSMHVRP